MARSFDRTTASLDNAVTDYFTNIVPQAADLNQGPWSDLEFVLLTPLKPTDVTALRAAILNVITTASPTRRT